MGISVSRQNSPAHSGTRLDFPMGRDCPVPFFHFGASIVAVAVAFGFLVPVATGQTVWSRPYEANQIAVEAIVPAPFDADRSVLSGGAFLTGTYSLTDQLHVGAELPVARADPSGSPSSTALGNPYVGIALSGTSRPVLLEIGARLPVASSASALRSGGAADVGRTRAFVPNEVSGSALLSGRLQLGTASTLRLRAGGSYGSFSPSDTTSRRSEQDWRLDYSLQYWREGDAVIFGLSVVGHELLTNPGRYSQQRQHAILASIMAAGSRAHPGLMAGVSAEDFDNPAALVGLTLSIPYAR